MTAPAQTATEAVQTMLYATIGGGAISAPVYDQVPQGAAFPYVTIGEFVETRDDAHNRAGKNLLGVVHVWSRDTSMIEAEGIAQEIDALLDHKQNSLSVSGWTLVLIENESTRTLRVPNAGEGTASRHVVQQYRVRVQE